MHVDPPAKEVSAAEFLFMLGAKNHHLPLLLEVQRVDEPPFLEDYLFNRLEFRGDAGHGCPHGLGAKDEVVVYRVGDRSHHAHVVLEFLAGSNLEVAFVKFYPSAFLVTAGGEGSDAAPNCHGVGHKAVTAALEGVDDAVSGAKKAD